MVILLINAVKKHLIEELGCEAYEEYSDNLVLGGFSGLEHYNGAHIIEIYTTGYQCKGNQQLQTWSKTSNHLMNMYCSNPDNQSRTIWSLMGKMMSDISRGMSITKDQACFILGGGVLKNLLTGHL
jgi:hypothetical protein